MSLAYAILLAAFAIPAAQQAQTTPSALPQSTRPEPLAGTTAIVPEQLRHVQPPSPTSSAEDLESMGDLLRTENAFSDALDYYRAAMRKNNTAVLHDKAGIAELSLFHVDEARHEFERAVKMDRAYPEAYNNLGVIAYYRHNFKKAIKYYNKAIKLRATMASFHSNLGSAYFSRKEYELAMGEYGRALQLDPEIFEQKSRTGVSLQLVGSLDQGRYDYVIAKVYATSGDSDHCLLYLQKAMEDGYQSITDVYKDPEFERIRKDPRFVSLMASKPPPLPN